MATRRKNTAQATLIRVGRRHVPVNCFPADDAADLRLAISPGPVGQPDPSSIQPSFLALLAIGTAPGVSSAKNRFLAVGDALECGIERLGAQRREIQA
jgi:hypothetical protein